MTAHVSYNYGENEWYTPVEYINLAREVMGAIDLDPASSAKANEIVCATIYYDKQSDGLQQNWGGRLWLNPPYAKGLICKFIDKLVESNIVEAIVLVNNATETKWFRKLISITCAVVFPSTRIKFLDQDGNPGAPLQGQCFVYIGKNTSPGLERRLIIHQIRSRSRAFSVPLTVEAALIEADTEKWLHANRSSN